MRNPPELRYIHGVACHTLESLLIHKEKDKIQKRQIMNPKLIKVITYYATKTQKECREMLKGKSPDDNVSVLLDLLTNYFNDKNSSTLREFVVVSLSGFTPRSEKIGYNGYKQDKITGKTIECEAKPKNINTNDGKSKKLNGGGSFNDYTWKRFKKDKRVNPLMIIGGFMDGRLIYIFRFPFNTPTFRKRLEEQLKKRFPGQKDISGQYLRGANFSFRHYHEAKKLEAKLYIDENELEKCKKYLTGGIYTLLKENT